MKFVMKGVVHGTSGVFGVAGKAVMVRERTAVLMEYFSDRLAINDANDNEKHWTTYERAEELCDEHIM